MKNMISSFIGILFFKKTDRATHFSLVTNE